MSKYIVYRPWEYVSKTTLAMYVWPSKVTARLIGGCLTSGNRCRMTRYAAFSNEVRDPRTTMALSSVEPSRIIFAAAHAIGISNAIARASSFIGSNENKMSDGGRDGASLGVDVLKSSQEWSAQRSARSLHRMVRCFPPPCFATSEQTRECRSCLRP